VPRYKRPGNVKVLFTTDLESDGKKEVIAGCDNWRFYCLNADGTERWFYESVHRSTSGMAADLDGDGKQEVALGTEYYWWHLANWKGERVWSYSTRTGPRANCLASADLDGDEKQEVIFGGADGNLHVLSGEPDSRSRGKLLWQTNLGDEVRGMQCLDIDGDGRQEILAASDSFYVFCVNGDGSIRWRKEVGDAALCLDVLADEGKSRVAVGCANGSIVVVDKKGEITGQFQASGAVRKVRFTKKGDQHLIVAVTAAGELGVFGLASIAGP
ncbi:MAG: FG-GAP-like repeat-containing protein, partial [Planctomycetota bacterium]|nr:FG-GAP-like repeat-containing protein [Planctomycetota bacterium]